MKSHCLLFAAIPSFERPHMKTPLLVQSIVFLLALSTAPSRASELDNILGLSIENVSTNTIAITAGLLESVTKNRGEIWR